MDVAEANLNKAMVGKMFKEHAKIIIEYLNALPLNEALLLQQKLEVNK